MVAGPEIARLVNEYDEYNDKHDGKNHEQSAAVQVEFRKDVCEVTGIVQRMGNPNFDLVIFDIKLVMDSSLVQTLKTA